MPFYQTAAHPQIPRSCFTNGWPLAAFRVSKWMSPEAVTPPLDALVVVSFGPSQSSARFNLLAADPAKPRRDYNLGGAYRKRFFRGGGTPAA